MGLETGTYINDFVRTNPLGTDDRSTADDHLRLIKDFILNTFPNINNEVTASDEEINLLVGRLGALIDTQGGQTITGDLTLQGDLSLEAGYNEDVDVTAAGGAITLDLALATFFNTPVLTSIPTFTFSNPAASGKLTSFSLELNNAVNFVPVWPTSVDWPSGVVPLWSSGKDLATFLTRDGGTIWLGLVSGIDLQ